MLRRHCADFAGDIFRRFVSLVLPPPRFRRQLPPSPLSFSRRLRHQIRFIDIFHYH